MPSLTTNYGITKPDTTAGDQWGATANANYDLIDSSLATASGSHVVASGSQIQGAVEFRGLGSVSLHSSGSIVVISGSVAAGHGSLTGLTDDDHSQYTLLAGRASGQTLIGGIAASDNLTLRSTSDGSKGQVRFDETTDSSSVTDGSVVLDGGIGVFGRANVGSISASGVGTASEQFGHNADTSFSVDAVAVGAGATAGADGGVSIGAGAFNIGIGGTAVGSYAAVDLDGGLAVGSRAYAVSISGIAIGNLSYANSNYDVAIGADAFADGTFGVSSISIGSKATCVGGASVALGANATCDNINSFSLGASSAATINSVALGTSAKAEFGNNISIAGAATAANQCIIGGANTAITTVIIGKGPRNTAPSTTLTIQGTGGTSTGGNNKNGASIILQPGQPTGSNATTGFLRFNTTTVSGSGNAPQRLVERLTLQQAPATTSGAAVFNGPQEDYDFRIRGGADSHLFFADANVNNIGIGTSTPHPAAKLELVTTSGGFLPPRLSNSQKDGIPSPPDGLLIWNTTSGTLNVRQAGAWKQIQTF